MSEPLIKPTLAIPKTSAPVLVPKVIKSYNRRGLQFGDVFIRPDLNKVVTPVGKEQEAFCAELIKQGILYVVSEE